MLIIMPLWLYLLLLPAIIAWRITCWFVAISARVAIRLCSRRRKST